MIENEVSFTSLCYIFEDYNGVKWLQRVADVEDGELYTPYRSSRPSNYFENRDRLYRKGDPERLGTVGVWRWTAVPDRTDPTKDHIESHYLKELSPIRVVVLTVNSLEQIVEQLKRGVEQTKIFYCDTLYCFQPMGGKLIGVLCRADEIEVKDNQLVSLSERVFSLPCYSFPPSLVFYCDDRNSLRFLNTFEIGEPSGYIPTGNTDEIIQTMILERSTWPLFKACIGSTKADWRNCKTLLERICGDSLYELLADRIKCPPEEAKRKVDDYIIRASRRIDAGDIDADVLARIAIHHDELRGICEEIVAQRWTETHKTEISKAEQALANINKEVATEAEHLQRIRAEVEAEQIRLDQLLEEIKRNESIGEETIVAVRKKISAAKNDMASFIAELSPILQEIPGPVNNRAPGWRYISSADGAYSEDEYELSENWNNEFDSIYQNLSSALMIDTDMCVMLTAFLYAAYINNVPVLIAGPGGEDIADVFSISIFGNASGKLILGESCGGDMEASILDYSEPIVSVENMFGKGWSDSLPQKFSRIKKHIFWTHPYTEDLQIEPNGLYNYMLPVFSESIVGAILHSEPIPGRRTKEFKAFVSDEKRPLRITAIKRLGLSKIMLNHLERVLTDAKALLNTPAREKDIEILFGLLPLSVLTGRTDILKECLDSESGISSSVKDEAARYFNEEQ